jgi:hypothetical protein
MPSFLAIFITAEKKLVYMPAMILSVITICGVLMIEHTDVEIELERKSRVGFNIRWGTVLLIALDFVMLAKNSFVDSVITKFTAPWGTDMMSWDPAPLDSAAQVMAGIVPPLFCSITFMTFSGCTAVAETLRAIAPATISPE